MLLRVTETILRTIRDRGTQDVHLDFLTELCHLQDPMFSSMLPYVHRDRMDC